MFKYVKSIIFALFFSSVSVFAQDIITLRTGEQIKAKVTEISLSEIRYKLFDHLDGPTRVITRDKVFAISYENGTREVINPFTETSDTQPVNMPNVTQTANEAVRRQQPSEAHKSQTGGNTVRHKNLVGGNLFLWIPGIGAKYYYGVSNAIRIGGEFSIFPVAFITMWDISLNGHYLFHAGKRVDIFPSAGLGIFNVDILGFGVTTFAFSFGGGVDFKIGKTFVLTQEVRVKISPEGGTFPLISLGIAKKF